MGWNWRLETGRIDSLADSGPFGKFCGEQVVSNLDQKKKRAVKQ